MADKRLCGKCGVELTDVGPERLCPACLLEGGLAAGGSVADAPPWAVALASRPAQGTTVFYSFGDYELLEEIARGGMGIVYRARQVSLNRIVAVKVLISGLLANPEFVQRFRAEAAAAASLQHRNIVAIHEVGFREGQHFFAMDYVRGSSLAELTRNGPLAGRRAAGYVKTIAEAIHYAHERGILHRDLKPANVLIDENDQPRVTDFGLAKDLHKQTDLTLSGQVLGSPSYMSPEQAGARRGLVGKRSDVYSLGAILYHLLTARAPFLGDTIAKTLHQVQNDEPVSPRLLNGAVPQDLATICLKCLEKEPDKRYATAQDLAEDLGRFLERKPILARPISRPEKLWRWCRRNPVVATLAATAVLIFVLGFAGVTWQWKLSERSRAQANANLYAANMNLAHQAWEEGDWTQARRLLRTHIPGRNQEDLRGFEWRYLWRLCRDESRLTFSISTNFAQRGGGASDVYNLRLALSPDGRILAVATGRGVSLWDFGSQRQLGAVEVPEDDVRSLAFCPTQPYLLAGGAGRSIWLWDAITRRVIATCDSQKETIAGIAFSPDGKTLAAAHWEGTIGLWDIETRQLVRSLAGHEEQHADHRAPAPALSVAFSPDGTLLASGGGDTKVRLWNPATGEQIGAPLDGHSAYVYWVEFSPDGRLLATTGFDARVLLWDVATRRPGPPLLGHHGGILSVVFSPDGKTLISGGMDHTIRFWSLSAWRQIAMLRGHRGEVRALSLSPDRQSLVSSSNDNTVKVWDAVLRPEHEVLPQHTGWVQTAALAPDGKTLASSDFHTLTVKLWDVASRRLITNFLGDTGVAKGLAFSPDARVLASGGEDRTVRLWHVKDLKLMATHPCEFSIESVAFSSDGRIVGAAGDGLRFWRVGTQQELALLHGDTRHVTRLAFAASGALLATSGRNNKVTVWDANDGTERISFRDGESWIGSLGISRDGRFVAVGKGDGTVILFDSTGQMPLKQLKGHTGLVRSVAFTPDSRTLASASLDGTARLWNLATGQPTLTITHVGPINSISFSADGNLMVTCGADASVKLWPAASFDEIDASEPAEAHPD
jgi:WD40 repeat protein/serine/threonine protein kinase